MAKKKNNKNKNKPNNTNNDVVEGDQKEEETKSNSGDNGGGGETEGKKAEKADNDSGSGGGKSKNGAESITVVLKTDMHCEGCASKISKCAKTLSGVESAKADFKTNKVTVVGKVEPLKVRDALHDKTKKKVDLVSPLPVATTKGDKANNNNSNKNKEDNKVEKKQDGDKKPKEPPVTTAVIKLAFHCQGCIEKIQKTVSKFKGVQEVVKLDKEKETVTVKGTMDVKALIEALKAKLKRPVEFIPPKKDEKKDGSGEKDGGGNSGGGGKKKGGGGQDSGGQDNAGAVEMARMEMIPGFGFGYGPGFGYMGQPVYGNGYMAQPVYGNANVGQPVYVQGPDNMYGYPFAQGQGQVPGYPVHMRFNDENPNACSIM